MKRLLTFSVSFGLASATLLAAGVSAPSWARDTDIYSRSDTAHSTDTIQPNVLLVLDNSQSMLAPDGWKEYPGRYDPNVEYLWNLRGGNNGIDKIKSSVSLWNAEQDSTGINNNYMGYVSDAPCESNSDLSTGVSDADLAEVAGALTEGADHCEPANFVHWIRQWPNFKHDVLALDGTAAYSDTETRATVRNYAARRQLFWLPSATADTDRRLWSTSLNRWVGTDWMHRGVRGGVNYNSVPNWWDNQDGYNRCLGSRRALQDAGVMTPNEFFSKAELEQMRAGDGVGVYRGKTWVRWERYGGVVSYNNAQYPGPTSAFNQDGSGGLTSRKWNGSYGLTQPTVERAANENMLPVLQRPFFDTNNDEFRINESQDNNSQANWGPLRADGGGWYGINELMGRSDNGSEVNSGSDALIVRLMSQMYPGFADTVTGHPYYYHYAAKQNWTSVPLLPNGSKDVSQFVMPWGYYDDTNTKAVSGSAPQCPSQADMRAQMGSGEIGTRYDVRYNKTQTVLNETKAEAYCEDPANRVGDNGVCEFTGGDQRVWLKYSNCQWSGRSYYTNEQGETWGYGGTCGRTSGNGVCAIDYSKVSTNPEAPTQSLWAKQSIDNQTCRAIDNNEPTCGELDSAIGGSNCRYDRVCRARVDADYEYYDRKAGHWHLIHDCAFDEGDSKGLRLSGRSFGSNSPYESNTRLDTNTLETLLTNNPDARISLGVTLEGTGELFANPQAIDVYSSNYLNWRFGVKGPNGHPVGRMTRMSVAKKALSEVIEENEGVRFGLMVFNSAQGGSNADGGKVVFRVSDMNATNKAALLDAIAKVEANSSTPLAETMYEAKLYFAGSAPWKGTSQSGYDPLAVSGGKYVSPMADNPSIEEPAQCQKNYSILVTDGDPDFDTDANSLIQSLQYTHSQGQVVAADQIKDTWSTRTSVPSPNETGVAQFAGTLNPAKPAQVPDLAHMRMSQTERFSWLDELTYYMKNADLIDTTAWQGQQNVTNFVIGFSGASSEVLKASATFAEDDSDFYTADSIDTLKDAIQAALQGIRRWTPVRSAPVVGINSKNRAETGDDVYMAFFEPGDNANWRGTLKRYKLYTELQQLNSDGDAVGYDPTALTCAQPDDADGVTTDSTPVGQIDISECLVAIPPGVTHDESVWDATFEGVDLTAKRTLIAKYTGVQTFQPASPDSPSDEPEPKLKEDVRDFFVTDVNHRDNAKGDSGGTGWKLIQDWLADNDFRNIYARIDTGVDDLTDAANAVSLANLTEFADRFGIDEQWADENIKLARGLDPDTGSRLDWLHGDILHSQPVMVHYDGQAETPSQSTLFYLANDGLLRAVDALSGRELWAFLVDEALCRYQAGPNISCSDPDDQPTRLMARYTAETGSEHLVLADGPVVVDVHDRTSTSDRTPNGFLTRTEGDRVTLMFGLRRGGRAYYALDITDRLAPKFMWKKDPSSGGAFSLMGQSWSKPTLGKIRGHYDTATRQHKPVAIFAGGYDPSFDYDYGSIEDVNGVDTATYPRVSGLNRGATIGLGVYVLDLLSGDLVRWFGPTTIEGGATNAFSGWDGSASYKTDETQMRFAIPSDLVGLNVDLDTRGYIDTAFVGDMGGQLWRLNFDPMDPAQWNVRKIANLNGDLTLNASVVADNDLPRAIFYPPAVVKDSDHLKVVVGTGAQELPLLTQTQDVVAMIKDSNTTIDPEQAVVAGDGSLRSPVTYLNSSLDGLESALVDRPFNELTAIPDDYDEVLTAQIAKVASSSVKGWVSRLALGEKVTGAPQVFNWWSTVPTWTPTLALNACTPAGLGRLRVFDAKAGAAAIVELEDEQGGSRLAFKTTLGPSARGYVDNSTLIFEDGEVRRLVNADGVTAQQSMNMQGVVETEYWYRELEN